MQGVGHSWREVPEIGAGRLEYRMPTMWGRPRHTQQPKLDCRSAFAPSLGAWFDGRRCPPSGALEIVRAVSGPTTNPEVFACFWRFAAERQRIFYRRWDGEEGPWTEDPILRSYRFCNVFRAADRVSQDLIATAYARLNFGSEDIFLRTVLYRFFSRPATWRLIEAEFGTLTAANFNPERLGDLLEAARTDGQAIYTGAFILCASDAYGHRRKHRNHLALLSAMLEAGLPARVAGAQGLSEVFDLLSEWPLVGPFMAYQLAIDLNYTTLVDFDEDEFTVPGPGALRGLRKVFTDLGDLTPSQAVHWPVDYQDRAGGELGVQPPTLFGRRLHAIDAQNLLCEVDKYCRVAFPQLTSNRTRIKQRFNPDPAPLQLAFPPKWGLNPGPRADISAAAVSQAA